MSRKKNVTDVFVSYASEDYNAAVSRIAMALYETGIVSFWIDRLRIAPGDSIPAKIDEGLNSALYLVPIITKIYFNKQDKSRITRCTYALETYYTCLDRCFTQGRK